MEQVTFIIPIHEFNDDVKKYLHTCLDSIISLKSDSPIIIIGPKEMCKSLKEFDGDDKKYTYSLKEYNSTNVFELVNNAVNFCLTDYFSVVEFDDTFNDFWYNEFLNYKKYNNASIYLPIVEIFNKEGKIEGFVNEIAWSSAFAKTSENGEDKLGYIDLDGLKSNLDFNVTGSFIKTEDFISVGGLDKSFEMIAWHELLMKLANSKHDIYVVPKVGYSHILGRKGSYSDISSKTFSEKDVETLIKKEMDKYTVEDSDNDTKQNNNN